MYWGVPMIWPAAVSVAHGPCGLAWPHQLRQAEVGDLHPALLVQQDVLRLDVAVDHAVVVGVLQRLADLRHDGQGFLGRELAGVQQPAQVHAVDELHEEVVERALSPWRPLPRLLATCPAAAVWPKS